MSYSNVVDRGFSDLCARDFNGLVFMTEFNTNFNQLQLPGHGFVSIIKEILQYKGTHSPHSHTNCLTSLPHPHQGRVSLALGHRVSGIAIDVQVPRDLS